MMQSDNEKMLQEIVQNTEMGKNTLDELIGLTHDQRLKDEMMRQKREYRRINQAAHTALDAIGAQAHGQSAAARMSVSMGIRTRTMLDKSTHAGRGQRPGRAGLQAGRERLPGGQPRRAETVPGTGDHAGSGRSRLAGVHLNGRACAAGGGLV